MTPAAHNDESGIDERVSAASVTRETTESNHRPHEIIDTVETDPDAEKEKDVLAQSRTREVGNAEDEHLNSTETQGVDEIDYPSAPKLALLTIGLCLVLFVVSRR